MTEADPLLRTLDTDPEALYEARGVYGWKAEEVTAILELPEVDGMDGPAQVATLHRMLDASEGYYGLTTTPSYLRGGLFIPEEGTTPIELLQKGRFEEVKLQLAERLGQPVPLF